MPYKRDILPGFAGLDTLARCPHGSLDAVPRGAVAVLGVTIPEIGEYAPLALQGATAIRRASAEFAASLEAAGRLIDFDSGRTLSWPVAWNMVDLGDLVLYPDEAMFEEQDILRTAVRRVRRRGGIPLVLGGWSDLFMSIADYVPATRGSRVGFIRFAPSLRAVELWDGIPGVVIGLQGLQRSADMDNSADQGLAKITAQEVHDHGIAQAIDRALAALKGVRSVYVSVDMAVVDIGHSAAALQPVVGGLSPRELLDAAARLARRVQLAAVDVMGVEPSRDNRRRTERLAAEVAIELVAPLVFHDAQAVAK